MAYYGQPMMASVSGTDYNHDGIPDQLQGGMMGAPMMAPGMMGAPMMGAPMMGGMGMPYGAQSSIMGACYANGVPATDYNHNGIPDRMEGGMMGIMGRVMPDRNMNGIPDFLEPHHRRYY
eukprot:TRINITY_DN6348_c0_g2_i1.p1 TRINITY_DN6348_c0_g2~~TRINITY_DN6348_c0_g2_i1.p1  ORF type:complete len:120 (+),score=26.36 TRINITY_DN6348_c0_g2_i1:80-439(+)